MDWIFNVLALTLSQVWTTFLHNWPFLLGSTIIAVLLQWYVDADRISAFLIRHKQAGVIAATAAAVGTPLCSCGTTAVILGMMASMLPWAPIVAFMISSPLTSPQELVYSAGLFGWPFAVAFFLASIALGLAGGKIAAFLEQRGWLANQSRFITAGKTDCSLMMTKACECRKENRGDDYLNRPMQSVISGCYDGLVSDLAYEFASAQFETESSQFTHCQTTVDASIVNPGLSLNDDRIGKSMQMQKGSQNPIRKFDLKEFLHQIFTTGRRLLLMFIGFAFIGYFLNNLIPASWISALFGSGQVYGIPLAATLGLPLYLNSEASLPLVRAMLDNGMSQGAALAFLITGAGTSIGALTGAPTIARWRILALIVAILWVGAVISAYLFNLFISLGSF